MISYSILITDFDRPSPYGEREYYRLQLARHLGALVYGTNARTLTEAGRYSLPTLRAFPLIRWAQLLYMRFASKVRSALVTSTRSSVGTTIWCRILGMRVTWLVWNSGELLRVWTPRQWILRTVSRAAQLVVFYEETKRALVASGYAAEHITVVTPGVDIAALSAQASIYDQMAENSYRTGLSLCYVIGVVSPLVLGSGVETVITAVKNIKELIPQVQLIIVGDGPEKKKLQWLVRMVGVQNQVRFVGIQDGPQRWYQFFDVTVIPTAHDTLYGRTILESVAAGKPVLCCAGEGYAELVGDGDRWILQSVCTVETLTQALLDLEHSAEAHGKIAEARAAQLEQSHDMHQALERWKQII